MGEYTTCFAESDTNVSCMVVVVKVHQSCQ